MIIKKEDGSIVEIIEKPLETVNINTSISIIEGEIARKMLIKTEPDKETLELWNSLAELSEPLISSLEQKKAELLLQQKELSEALVSTVEIKPVPIVDVEPIIDEELKPTP